MSRVVQFDNGQPAHECELSADELLRFSQPHRIGKSPTGSVALAEMPGEVSVEFPITADTLVMPAMGVATPPPRPSLSFVRYGLSAAILIATVAVAVYASTATKRAANSLNWSEGAALPSFDGNPRAVRFANPFDGTEVFEFPPGTSEAEAQRRVAALLLERARARRPDSSKS